MGGMLDYVAREMTDPASVQMLGTQHLAFYSTQDADSEVEGGKSSEGVSSIPKQDCLREENVLTRWL